MKNLIYLLCLFTGVVTAQMDNLNAAAALVDRQLSQDNDQIMAALTAVVSKKSGLTEADIKQQGWLDHSFKSVVLRHYYEQVPTTTDYSGLWFHVVTDSSRLNRMLIDRNVPLWPPNRPNLFIWMVEELEDGTLLQVSSDSAAQYWLHKMLSNKGIEHQFYNSMDAELLQFKPEDVSFLNPDLVSQVYQDYQPDQVLLVKLRHFRSGYSYRAGLFESVDSDAHIENRQFVALSDGLGFLATSIQQRLADGQRIEAGKFGDFTLAVTINNIKDASAMLNLWQYLQNQPLIKDFQATAYSQSSLQLQINAMVDSDAFIQVVGKDGLLKYMPLGINNRTVFSWQP